MTRLQHSSETFSLGEFRCSALADGEHTYDAPVRLLFPDAPADQLRKELSAYAIVPDQWHTWTSTYTCLLVDTGKHLVLLDSGAGAFLQEAGRLTASLQAHGITPADIDFVIFSHAHPDHIGFGGFPNARLIMSRSEWQFWHSKPELPRLPQPMAEALLRLIPPALDRIRDRLELLENDREIIPGIRTLSAPGHTPGHLAVSISSSNQTLLYTGDAFLHPIHLKQPHWNALVDVLPDLAEKTRSQLLRLATDRQASIFGFHFPYPHLLKIRQHRCFD